MAVGAVFDVPCREGMADAYPCRAVDPARIAACERARGRRPHAQRRLGVDRPGDRARVRDRRPAQRHGLRRRQRTGGLRLSGSAAHAGGSQQLARHEGLRGPRVHRLRGLAARDAGLRPAPAARRRGDAGGVLADGPTIPKAIFRRPTTSRSTSRAGSPIWSDRTPVPAGCTSSTFASPRGRASPAAAPGGTCTTRNAWCTTAPMPSGWDGRSASTAVETTSPSST